MKASGDDSAVWDPPLDLVSAAERVDASNKIIPEEHKDDPLEPQLKFPANLKELKVRVSCTNSPSSFYVQLTEFDSQLKRSVVSVTFKTTNKFA